MSPFNAGTMTFTLVIKDATRIRRIGRNLAEIREVLEDQPWNVEAQRAFDELIEDIARSLTPNA